jgi:hypothetical protein
MKKYLSIERVGYKSETTTKGGRRCPNHNQLETITRLYYYKATHTEAHIQRHTYRGTHTEAHIQRHTYRGTQAQCPRETLVVGPHIYKRHINLKPRTH